jgi:alkylhydroperoxidase family enzyme
MTRLPLATDDELSDATREQLLTRPPVHLYRMVAHAPTLLGPFMNLVRTNFTQLSLAHDLREIVILRVAMHHGCDYEIFHHRGLAEKAGVPVALIGDLLDRQRSLAAFSVVQRCVIELVDETLRDACPSDACFGAVVALLGKRVTVEVALLIGFYRMVATFASIVDLRPEHDLA